MKNITFINAGAGSGKTFSLTEELYKNINNGTCRGDQVLLTTFTKKAAKEIKDRAYTKLLETGKIEDAILLQNANIGTVHSVGYHLIKKFCYLIGLSPNIKELSEGDTDFYFSQAISAIPSVEDLDKLALLSEQFDFQKMSGIVKEFDPNKWKDHVKTIISEARRNSIEDLTEEGLSFVNSLGFISTIFGARNATLIDVDQIKSNLGLIFQYLENLPEANNKGRKEKGQKLKISLNSKSISYSHFIEINDIASDIIKNEPANVPASNLLRTISSFYLSGSFQNGISEYIRLVFKIARECIDEFENYKKKNMLVDYTDMETNFFKLLNIPEVRNELKENVKLVMVDEFQDSNPVQLSIFLKLAEISDQNIWVGDPKQAIYGFNGSDPMLVNKLLERFYNSNDDNLKVKLLKNSWRSRTEIVDITNKMFEVSLEDQAYSVQIKKNDILGQETSIQQWIDEKFGLNEQITLSARDTIGLIPTRNDTGEGFDYVSDLPALRHWHFTNNLKGSGNAEQLNYYLARRIKVLLNEEINIFDKNANIIRRLRPSDVAVLCRKNEEVKNIASELLKNGIEVAANVDGLSTTAEYRLLVNILSYLADQGNSLAISEILLLINHEDTFTPELLLEKRLDFISEAPNADEENKKERYDYLATWGGDHPFLIRLNAFKGSTKHLSVPELIEKAVAELELSRHISAWGHAEQRKANIQQLIAYAYAYDDYCVKLNIASSLAGFVQWQSQDKDKNNQAASFTPNAVNVLTYHKAKGLEWPFVVLSSLNYDCTSNLMEKDFFKTTVKMSGEMDIENPLNGRYINFSFWPFGSKEKIMGYEAIIQSSKEYQEAVLSKIQETKRLLYVGITRARDYLTTTSFKQKEYPWIDLVNNQGNTWSFKSTIENNKQSQIVDLFGQGIFANYEVIKDERPEFSSDYDVSTYKPGYFFPKAGSVLQDNPKYISPSRLVSETEVSASILNDFSHRIIIGKIEDESRLGNCLHNLLYLWPESIDESRIRTIIARHNFENLIDINSVMSAVTQFKDFISNLAPVYVYREMSMQMGKADNIYIGSADLVLEFNDSLILIDYKSYPGKVADVLDRSGNHFAGKYAGQLDAYAEILESATGKKVSKKLIFYSVLGQIIELA
jgi:ATP-dependent helicase/nuclease subunit A